MSPFDCKPEILAVLHSLDVLEEKRDTIEAEANNLALAAYLAWADSQPHLEHVGTSRTLDELQGLHDKCFFLLKFIHEMHADALAAVQRETGLDLLRSPLARALGETSNAAVRAIDQVEQGPKVPGQKGARMKKDAFNLVCDAAGTYERLTGRDPARSYNKAQNKESGAFLDYVDRIFAAVKIEAKAAGQVKSYLDRMKRGEVPQTRTFNL